MTTPHRPASTVGVHVAVDKFGQAVWEDDVDTVRTHAIVLYVRAVNNWRNKHEESLLNAFCVGFSA